MKIIISPAKKMRMDDDAISPCHTPVFIEKADQLRRYLRGLSLPELKRLLDCNDAIAALNYARYQEMDLHRFAGPALLCYDGIQYQYMAPQVFEDNYFAYVDKHLRILSGFYGILRPRDGVVLYRLEMQAQLKTPFCSSLYKFWGDSIYQELARDEDLILNLASKEYSRTVERYLTPEMRFVTCIFGQRDGGRIREKGVYVKMARGEMVRFMAENNITDAEGIKAFDRLGFAYSPGDSAQDRFVFLRD